MFRIYLFVEYIFYKYYLKWELSMTINIINLKALASLANELNIHVGLLELKLKDSGIIIQKTEPCGFKSNRRRHVLELY